MVSNNSLECAKCGAAPATFRTNGGEDLCRQHYYIRHGFPPEQAAKLAAQRSTKRDE